MVAYWGSNDFYRWASSGCDIKRAAGVVYLSFSPSNYPDTFVHTGALFKHFVNLRKLDLSYRDLTTIPDEVWELTQLTNLRINNNNICEISPKIKNLTKLEQFECQSNNITSFPVEICQLTKLVHFNFANNKLDILDSDVVNFISQINHSVFLW